GSLVAYVTPAFTFDEDRTTFTDDELSAIYYIWKHAAEDFSPFNINVTTVRPAKIGYPTSIEVLIGGDGAWFGNPGYIAGLGGGNAAVVFSEAMGNAVREMAEVVSHEAGHAFGLFHQSSFDANGNLVATYYEGPGDGTAPIMGESDLKRGL